LQRNIPKHLASYPKSFCMLFLKRGRGWSQGKITQPKPVKASTTAPLTKVKLLDRELLLRLSKLPPLLKSPSLQLGARSGSISKECDFWWLTGIPTELQFQLDHRRWGRSQSPILGHTRSTSRKTKHRVTLVTKPRQESTPSLKPEGWSMWVHLCSSVGKRELENPKSACLRILASVFPVYLHYPF
jgi:hypothetical protein